MLYVDPAPAVMAAYCWLGVLMLILICSIAMGIVCTVIAKKKGRSGAWFLGGFFLGLIGLVIVLCLHKKQY